MWIPVTRFFVKVYSATFIPHSSDMCFGFEGMNAVGPARLRLSSLRVGRVATVAIIIPATWDARSEAIHADARINALCDRHRKGERKEAS